MTGETLDVKDICSPVIYQVAPPLGNILTLSGDTLTLESNDKNDATLSPQSITITAELQLYPAVTVATTAFTI